MNIKFPKQNILFLNEIKKLIINRDYKSLLNEYNNIILNASFLNQYAVDALNNYFDILFDIKEYDKYITLVEELKKKDIENFKWYFYLFTILLHKKDIYYAKSIISRSKILNYSSIKYLISEEEGNYGQVMNLHNLLLQEVGPCLILVNFINELLSESFNMEINDEYIIMRYFDLINLMFEYGMSEDFISIFTNTLETIYEIDIV